MISFIRYLWEYIKLALFFYIAALMVMVIIYLIWGMK